MKNFRIRLLILAVLLLVAAFSIYTLARESRAGELTVAFLNIGQGDAIFIEAPNGNQLLLDGGPSKAVLRELSKVMPFYDRSIDVVVASHADQDHVGGLPDVLQKYRVGIFMEPGVPGESSAYEELQRKLDPASAPSSHKATNGQSKATAGKEIKKILARRGMTVDLGEGATLQILFPDRDPAGMETNTSSIVARLVYGESEFLLTGDSPKAIEEYLVSLEQECQRRPLNCPGPKGSSLTLASDVLKAGHHGSKTSTGATFLAAVSPQYVVISSGKDNKYGHPNQEVLDILDTFGAEILRTDTSGRIIFKSDGVNLNLE